MIRELFRGVETTLYERLRIIEDILVKQRQEDTNPHMAGVEKNLHETIQRMQVVEDATAKQIEQMNKKFDKWMEGMCSMQEEINTLRVELRNRNKVDERPVELVQAQLEQKSTLENEPPATVVEKKAKVALENAIRALPIVAVKEEVEEVEVEEEVEEEEVVEETEEEEVEVEEEVVEEEVEEEEEEALTPFDFKGKTYYHDADYKVYIPDEDGAVSDPVGIYDPATKRIRRLPPS